jgi:Flp pilus assembly pilin Flp
VDSTQEGLTVVTNMMLEAAAWVTALTDSITQRLKDERGQDLLEYAVLGGAVALVAAVAIVASPIRSDLQSFVTKVGNCISLSNTCT